MNKQGFRNAGQICKQTAWTDLELEVAIEGLKCVIAFFEERGDALIIVSKLRVELSIFLSMRQSRREEKRSK